jgi:hypothetical protein
MVKMPSIILGIAIGMTVLPLPLQADTIPLLDSGMNPSPQEDTQIQMQSEVVTMHVSASTNKVSAQFVMINTGPATTLQVGFPVGYESALRDFTVSEDGQPMQTTVEEVTHPAFTKKTYWYVWRSSFQENQRKTVSIGYTVSVAPTISYFGRKEGFRKKGFVGGPNDRSTGYILKTGADWAGVIEEARINVELEGLTNEHLRYVSPEGASIAQHSIQWVLKNFEPQDNIVVVFNPSKTLPQEIALLEQELSVPIPATQFHSLARLVHLYQGTHQDAEVIRIQKMIVAGLPSGEVDEGTFPLGYLHLVIETFPDLIANLEKADAQEEAVSIGKRAASFFRDLWNGYIYYVRRDGKRTRKDSLFQYASSAEHRSTMELIIRKYGNP